MSTDLPLTVTVAAQLGPIGRYQNPDGGDPLAGTTIEQYVIDVTHYLATNLAKFTDPRDGDVFLYVVVKQGDATAGRTFRSGHFVKDADVTASEERGIEIEPPPDREKDQ